MAVTRAMTDLYNGPATSGEILSPIRDIGNGVPTALSASGAIDSIIGGDSVSAVTAYSGYRFATGGIDLSTRTFVGFQIAQNQLTEWNLDTFANGGIRIIFDDGTNWSAFIIYGGDIGPFLPSTDGAFGSFTGFGVNDQSFTASWFVDRDRTPFASSGTLDWSNVTHIEAHLLPTAANRLELIVGRIVTADAPIFTGVESTDVFFDIRTFYGSNGYVYPWICRPAAPFSLSSFQSIRTLQLGLQIGDGSTATTLTIDRTALSLWGRPEDYESTYAVPPNSVMLINRSRLVDVFQSASCNVTISNSLITSLSFVGFRCRGDTAGICNLPQLTFAPFSFMELGHSTSNGGVWDQGSVPVDVTLDTQVTQGTIRNSQGVRAVGPAGDYTNIDVLLNNNTPYDITVGSGGAGVYDFSSIDAPAGYSVKIHNESATNAVTVVVPPGRTYIDSTAGGAITIDDAVTVTLLVTVIDIEDGAPVQNARVRLVADSGGPETPGTVLLSGVTDVNGQLSTSYTYSTDQPVTGTVRKASPGDTAYKPATLAGSITSAGYNVPVTFVRD